MKFAGDTIVVGRITSSDETAYRSEVENLESLSQENNLILNAAKTKELILDFRKLRPLIHRAIIISGERVEVVQSIKYLGVNISHDMTWIINTTAKVPGQQRSPEASLPEVLEESTTPTTAAGELLRVSHRV